MTGLMEVRVTSQVEGRTKDAQRRQSLGDGWAKKRSTSPDQLGGHTEAAKDQATKKATILQMRFSATGHAICAPS